MCRRSGFIGLVIWLDSEIEPVQNANNGPIQPEVSQAGSWTKVRCDRGVTDAVKPSRIEMTAII